jgi:hypothetical protein
MAFPRSRCAVTAGTLVHTRRCHGRRGWVQRFRERRRLYWRGHVAAWRTSGQSRRDYCAAHGLSRKTFDWWAWRLERVDRDAGGPAEPARFLPVGIAGAPGAVTAPGVMGAAVERIEIALPDGVLVRVGPGFDAAALQRVLEVLGR